MSNGKITYIKNEIYDTQVYNYDFLNDQFLRDNNIKYIEVEYSDRGEMLSYVIKRTCDDAKDGYQLIKWNKSDNKILVGREVTVFVDEDVAEPKKIENIHNHIRERNKIDRLATKSNRELVL